MATGIVFLFAMDISWSRLLGRITHPLYIQEMKWKRKLFQDFQCWELALCVGST